jgi:hypothetical protein
MLLLEGANLILLVSRGTYNIYLQKCRFLTSIKCKLQTKHRTQTMIEKVKKTEHQEKIKQA